jgi:hypothetical protein
VASGTALTEWTPRAFVSPLGSHEWLAICPLSRGQGVLLPYDLRPDRVGWTVVEVETDRAALVGGVTLVGLTEEDAERLANALNRLELRCANLARRRVLDDLGLAWLYEPKERPT